MTQTPNISAKRLRAICVNRASIRDFFRDERVSLVLMVIGACLLLYVGSEYFAMYREQRELHARWLQQQKPSAIASSEVQPQQDDGLTRVSIPKINLDVIVVEGTNHKALRLGPGHLKDTPAPGEAGNSVISAHRDTFFRHIADLKNGDQIEVKRDGKTYAFEVTGRKIVLPNDVSVLKKTSDPELTLITCYPTYYIGPAPKRLVVFSKLVGGSTPQRAEAPAASAPRQGS